MGLPLVGLQRDLVEREEKPGFQGDVTEYWTMIRFCLYDPVHIPRISWWDVVLRYFYEESGIEINE